MHTLVEVGLPAAVVARRRRHCVSGKGGGSVCWAWSRGRKRACRSAVSRRYLASSWSELSKCGQPSGLTDSGNIYWMMQLPMRLPWASAAGPAARTGHMHSLELAASLPTEPTKKGTLPSHLHGTQSDTLPDTLTHTPSSLTGSSRGGEQRTSGISHSTLQNVRASISASIYCGMAVRSGT